VACEICDDTTWKTVTVDGISRVTRCDCVREAAARRRFVAAGIPDKYKHCTFESFNTHDYDSLNAAMRKAKRFVEEFPAFPAAKRGLIFQGSFGVGKTHLAVATLKGIIAKGGTGYFAEVAHLLNASPQARSRFVRFARTGRTRCVAPGLAFRRAAA
jgi:DNA replication protein DnaC